RLLAVVMAGGLLLRYTSNRQRLRALMYLVVGIGVASALFGIVRQVIRPNDLAITLHIPTVGAVALMYPHPDMGYGQFTNRNHFAFLMEMAFGLALGLAAGGRGHRGRQLLSLAAAAFVWTALVFTTSRGAVFSMLGQLLFAALLLGAVRSPSRVQKQRESTPGRWRRAGTSLITRAALVSCLMIVAAISVVWVGGDPLVGRLESLSKELNTGGSAEQRGRSRAEIWNATWQLIKANPVAGAGFGAYQTAIPRYHDSSGKWTPQQAHNDYLELLASGGVIGAVLVAWVIFAFVRQARAPLRASDPFRRAACFGALTGLFAVVLHSLVDFGLHITINALICTALVVIATINGRVEKKRSPGRHSASSTPFVA
nr:O-antigen ligase family protein [Pyrinomonadaceae bacterium]